MRANSRASRTSRITISLPRELLQDVDRRLVRHNETRSAAMRRVLQDALHDLREQEDIDRYVRSYRENPQTEEELGWADHAALERLKELPWK
jgi:metal-responsive CopG/Arc/MetJ family transcriptional regulator